LQPHVLYLVALAATGALLVGTCIGWIVDLRRPPGSPQRGLGTAFAVAFGVMLTPVTGLALMDSVTEVPEVYKHFYAPILVPYVALSAGALVAVVLAQAAGVVARSTDRARRGWVAAQTVLMIVSLACLWASILLLERLVRFDFVVSPFFAPSVTATALTALLLARAVAALVVPRPGPARPGTDETLAENAEDADAGVVAQGPTAEPAAVRGRIVDVSPYRRPPGA
jgi:hypothetical protein